MRDDDELWELIREATQHIADARPGVAAPLLREVVAQLELTPDVGDHSATHLDLELRARILLRVGVLEPLDPELLASAVRELALWDHVDLEASESAHDCGDALLSLGGVALMHGDLALAAEVRTRLDWMFADLEPPQELLPKWEHDGFLYLEYLKFAAKIERAHERPEPALGLLSRVLELVDRWGGYPWLEQPEAMEAILICNFVSTALEAHRTDAMLADLHDRLVRLLCTSIEGRLDDENEVMAVASLRLLEDAASMAAGCGRRSSLDEIEAAVGRYTTQLADRGSVVGQVLMGDLPETLARIAAYGADS
jgi:hypothetical protein